MTVFAGLDNLQSTLNVPNSDVHNYKDENTGVTEKGLEINERR